VVKALQPDPNPRPWLGRDPPVKRVVISKTLEMEGPKKGDLVVCNEEDQPKWAGRGWKPTGRTPPQAKKGPEATTADGTNAQD